MSRIYYYHYHPTNDFKSTEVISSPTPIAYDYDKSGYFSDRIYHSRNSNSRFYVVTFGYEKCWKQPPQIRTIDRYTFHFVFDGEGKINNTPMKKGCIYVVPSNTECVIIQSVKSPMTIGWIALTGTELEQMLGILHFPQEFSTIISDERIESIEKLFLQMVYTEHDTNSLPFLMLGNLFIALSLANINYSSPQPTSNVYITKAYQYINMHYSEDISVRSIADNLNISQSRLRGIFASELGISPQSAIVFKRMSVAKELMHSDSHPNIQTIAQMCGYFDQGAFCKRFKKETGLTPSEYIQSLKYTKTEPNQ